MLDLCCGQGRHVLELARRGYTKVCGLDRSHYLIRRARATRRREGLEGSFREGDALTPLVLWSLAAAPGADGEFIARGRGEAARSARRVGPAQPDR